MGKRRKPHRIPKTSARWSELMRQLRDIKPRPIQKLYGKKGPTKDQLANWKEEMSRWNSLYRIASSEQKRKLKIENEEYRLKNR